MRTSWRVARILGIDIGVDLSWFIIIILMVYTLGFIEFPRELHPRTFLPRADIVSVALGIAVSLLLFASVLAHELSHSWMAMQRGIPVTSITLFIFGGVAQIADEPERPASELLIAIMGPLMSLALAAVFGAAWLWLRILDLADWLPAFLAPLILLTGILAQANGALALFNLAPGFPLDGGRVLRAILWGIWRDIRRATRWATRAGEAIALALIALGGWQFLNESSGAGMWYVFIGLFLWNAAGEGYRQTLLRETLRRVRVEQLMTRTIEFVSPDLTIADFVNQHLLPRREQTFAVAENDVFVGIIASAHLARVPRQEWQARRVREAMTPRARLNPLAPQQTAASALAQLARSDMDELPVLEVEQLVGFLGRAELSRFLKLQ